MNSHQKLHQALLNEWASRFADQKASGLTVRDWCSQNNLSIHKYNYWKHQLKEAVTDQVLPDIAPLSLPIIKPDDSTVDCTNRAICTNPFNLMQPVGFSINGVNITLDANVPETFLCSLIKAVRYA